MLFGLYLHTSSVQFLAGSCHSFGIIMTMDNDRMCLILNGYLCRLLLYKEYYMETITTVIALVFSFFQV